MARDNKSGDRYSRGRNDESFSDDAAARRNARPGTGSSRPGGFNPSSERMGERGSIEDLGGSDSATERTRTGGIMPGASDDTGSRGQGPRNSE